MEFSAVISNNFKIKTFKEKTTKNELIELINSLKSQGWIIVMCHYLNGEIDVNGSIITYGTKSSFTGKLRHKKQIIL